MVFRPLFKVRAGSKRIFVIQTVVKCPLRDLTIVVKTNRLRGQLYPNRGGFELCALQIYSFCYFNGVGWGGEGNQAIITVLCWSAATSKLG